MAGEKSLEMQVRSLERGMGTTVKAFKELKDSVKALEEKVQKDHNEELREIMMNQKVLVDIITAYSDAIRRIDNEIAKLQNSSLKTGLEKKDKESKPKEKKCRYSLKKKL